jgi:hypothetical protein
MTIRMDRFLSTRSNCVGKQHLGRPAPREIRRYIQPTTNKSFPECGFRVGSHLGKLDRRGRSSGRRTGTLTYEAPSAHRCAAKHGSPRGILIYRSARLHYSHHHHDQANHSSSFIDGPFGVGFRSDDPQVRFFFGRSRETRFRDRGLRRSKVSWRI